jgi:hypothetical protein
MHISKKDLKEFKDLYKREFGKDLSDADSLEKATKLLMLVKAVYKPIAKNKNNSSKVSD